MWRPVNLEEIHSLEASILTSVIWCKSPEDGILRSHPVKNLKIYIELTGWAL
jgi:hypothetical protein